MSVQTKHLYKFGPFCLDPAKRRLMRDGELIKLTPKAFDTLLALVEHRGKTVEKDELLNKVWAGVAVEENNLNQSITALRKSLGDSRQESQYIATIPGVGYRFVADVKEVNGDESVAETPVAAPESRPVTRTRALRYALLVIVPLVLAAVVYALVNREKPVAAVSSIMVLPLENLSGDPSQEYFADGLTDALIGDLAKIGSLHVISRTSSMHYKGTKKSLPAIAAEMKVDAIVEGTVQRSGDRVVIRAQLIHAPTDRHLWVQTYERPIRDVLDLQSEIAQTIAQTVQIRMTAAEQSRLTARRAVRPKAFDDYLQGRFLYWNKRTGENLNKAIEHFRSAINEDPNYAP